MPEASAPTPDLTTVFGFGVAGNFAGHLEQAGEAADFVGVGDHQPQAPKGIFPWYVPSAAQSGGDDPVPEFLHTFPIASDELARPAGEALNLQIEPEVGLLARVTYDDSGRVLALRPEAIAAFNDCSIRRPGAKKISHKKNWGTASTGLSVTLLPVDSLDADGPTATYRLACFLTRDGQTHAYGVDSRLPDYSYYGQTLLDWIVERLANQTGADDTPLENVGAYLRAAGNPEHVLIGIGATRYTPLGETTFLEVGDESIVVVYDGARATPDEVAAAIAERRDDELPGASVLRQRVVAP